MNVEYKTVIRYHNRCNAFKVKNKKKKERRNANCKTLQRSDNNFDMYLVI